MTQLALALTALAVAGREFNDEMTVVASGIDDAMRHMAEDDPARDSLVDVRASLQRCIYKAALMLEYANHHGAMRTAAPLGFFLEGQS